MASISCSRLLIPLLLLCCSCATAIDGGRTRPPPPPRKKVAFEGVVYCSYCHRDTSNQLVLTRTPLPGAVLKLHCRNTRWIWEEKVETDEKGGFLVKPERVSSWGARKCRFFLVSSPISNCSDPGIPGPDPDFYPSYPGFQLTRAPVNDSSPFQYYYPSERLSFYDSRHSPCLP